MTVHLTEAEARRLGIDTKTKVRQRRTAPGPYATTCVACGEAFHTRVAEDHHVDDPGHHRYELILEFIKEKP